jgi:hypothetical protein
MAQFPSVAPMMRVRGKQLRSIAPCSRASNSYTFEYPGLHRQVQRFRELRSNCPIAYTTIVFPDGHLRKGPRPEIENGRAVWNAGAQRL